MEARPKAPRRTRRLLAGALASIAFFALVVWTTRGAPDLRAFSPAEMAAGETAMWRAYYENRWGLLALRTWHLARQQFGFSPYDSLRLGVHAAKAARAFRIGEHDKVVLPHLESYFTITAGLLERESGDICAKRSTSRSGHWFSVRDLTRRAIGMVNVSPSVPLDHIWRKAPEAYALSESAFTKRAARISERTPSGGLKTGPA